MRLRSNTIKYDKELQECYIRKNNIYDLLQGCINRICVTDNEDEITQMFLGATRKLLELSDISVRRIRIKEYLKKEGENNE